MIGFTSFCRCLLFPGFNRNTVFLFTGWSCLLRISLRSNFLSGTLSAHKQGILSVSPRNLAIAMLQKGNAAMYLSNAMLQKEITGMYLSNVMLQKENTGMY